MKVKVTRLKVKVIHLSQGNSSRSRSNVSEATCKELIKRRIVAKKFCAEVKIVTKVGEDQRYGMVGPIAAELVSVSDMMMFAYT